MILCVVRHASCEGTGYGRGLSCSVGEERERDNAALRAARSVHGRQQTARAAGDTACRAEGESSRGRDESSLGRLANHTVDVVDKRY